MRKYLVGLSLFFCLSGMVNAVDKVQIVENGTADGVTITDQRISVSSVSVHQLVSSGTLTISAPAGDTRNIVVVSTGSKELLRVHGSSIVFGVPAYLNTGALAGTGGSGSGASVTTATLNVYASDDSTQAAALWLVLSTGTQGLGFYVVGSSVYINLTDSIARLSKAQNWTANQVFTTSTTFNNGVAVTLTTNSLKIGPNDLIAPTTVWANGFMKLEGKRWITADITPGADGIGTDGDGFGSHKATNVVNMNGFPLNNVSSWTMSGVGDPVVYTDSRTIQFVVQGATYVIGATSFTVAWNNGPAVALSTKTPFNLPMIGGRFKGSSTMTIVNDTAPVNGGTLFDALSSTNGSNAMYFVWDLPGNLDNAFVPVLRHFNVACASAAGNNNNIVAAADGAAQTYTLSFATAGANTNIFTLAYTNPISMTLTGSTNAGGTRERRDLPLTGLQTSLSNQVTRLYCRLVRSGEDDASTTQSVFLDGLIELRMNP